MFIRSSEKEHLFRRMREMDDARSTLFTMMTTHIEVCKTENELRRRAEEDATRARHAFRKEMRGYLVAIIVALIGMVVAMRTNFL